VTHIAGGWEVGGILTVSTGTPFTLAMGGDPIGIKNGDSADFPDRIAGCNPINSNYRSTGQYLNIACFTPPTAPVSMTAQCAVNSFSGAAAAPSGQIYCQNLFGNNGRNSLIGPGLSTLDASIYKNNYIRRISESFNAQFRVEMFNALNHANYQSPIGTSTVFSSTGGPVSGAGKLTALATDARQIQLSLKVIW